MIKSSQGGMNMGKAELKTKTTTYFMCPACNEHEFDVDYYLKKRQNECHTISCDCGKNVIFTAKGNDIEIHDVVDGNEAVLDLLSYCHDDRLKLLVKGTMYRHDGKLSEDGREYWYNEHTCPINWTRDIAKVILDRDTDPHGVFRLQCTIRMPDAHSDESIDKVEAELNGTSDNLEFKKLLGNSNEEL